MSDIKAQQQTFQIDDSGKIVSTTSDKLNAFVDMLITEKTQELQSEITRLNAIIADMQQVGDIQQMIIDSEVTK